MQCMCHHGHGNAQHHGHGHKEQQSLGCYHGAGFRRFTSSEERIKMIEEYINELRYEIQGAEEHLEELKKHG